MSDSLRPQGLQHTRLLCPLISPRVCLDLCSLSQWGYPTISSSAAPFSFYPQSFPAPESFPMSWLFTLYGQSLGASASALAVNIQGWFPLGLIDLISLQSKGLSRVFLRTTIQEHQFFGVQPFLWSYSHPYMATVKKHCFDYRDLCWQSDVSAFLYAVSVGHSFVSKEQVSFNFMTVVTDCSAFGAPPK